MATTINFVRFFLVAVAAILVAAQDDRPYDVNNHFLSPPPAGPTIGKDKTVWADNEVYTVGTPLNIKWVSNHTPIRIQLFRDGTDQGQDITNSIPNGQFLWSGTLQSGVTLGGGGNDVFFFVAYDAANTALASTFFFYSHYFNLTNPPASSSTNSPASSTKVLTAGSTSSSATITSMSSSKSSNSSPSTAAAIGGGVGGGLGGAILILGAGFLILQYHKKKKKDNVLDLQLQQGQNSFHYPKANTNDLSSPYGSNMKDSQPMSPHLGSRHELPVA